ncbi:MAG: TonB-dependent receptor [Sphingobium sp.]
MKVENRKSRFLMHASLVVGAAAFFTPCEAYAAKVRAQANSGDEASSDGVSTVSGAEFGEIVVTAQKRAENLQNVPIAISVLQGKQLDKSTVGVNEQLSRVPGVSINQTGSNGATISVRGVGPATALFAGGSPIAFYLDAVPFGFVKQGAVPDTGAYDLDRVEVLRGPQGTLYGASASGGVVRILTRDPDLDEFGLNWRAAVLGTRRGKESYRFDSALNIPVVEDKFAARAVLSYQKNGGWIDRPNRENANDGELITARLKLAFQPSDQLLIMPSVWVSRSDYYALPWSPDGRTAPSTAEEYVKEDYNVFGLKITYDFPGFTLSSSTGYIDYDNDSFNDAVTRGDPATAINRLYARTFSEEVNLVSTGVGPWRWTTGAIYRNSEDGSFQKISTSPAPFILDYTAKSYAVFGEVTRLFLDDQLEISAGLRYFHERITAEESSDPLGRLPVLGVYSDDTFTATTPRFVVSWHPSKQATLYASYTEGFRSGVPQSSFVQRSGGFPAGDPDKLKSYEVGVKGNLFDGVVNYEAAAYYMDWAGVQQQVVLLPPVVPIAIFALVNGPSASGPGVDLALNFQPARSLKFGVNGSWNDLTMDSQIFSAGALVFDKGDRLNNSPKYTVGAFVDYEFELGDGFTALASGSVNHTAGQEVHSLGVDTKTDPQTQARASLSVSAPEHWTATLFVENLTNENDILNGAINSNRNLDIRPRPRTFGAQLQYRF